MQANDLGKLSTYFDIPPPSISYTRAPALTHRLKSLRPDTLALVTRDDFYSSKRDLIQWNSTPLAGTMNANNRTFVCTVTTDWSHQGKLTPAGIMKSIIQRVDVSNPIRATGSQTAVHGRKLSQLHCTLLVALIYILGIAVNRRCCIPYSVYAARAMEERVADEPRGGLVK